MVRRSLSGSLVALSSLSLLGVVSCGSKMTPPTMEGREGMLSRSVVAQKCDEASREHLRPFVIQWDATDLADFEAKSRAGTVLVRYEGCQLVPLYGCTDATRPFGSYGTPVFTSGTVQGLDVANEGELYGKLPLGAVSLSGRVQAGESLHLQYFVSGVATSSRNDVYRTEVERMEACKTATHYVYAYNLGAFELDSSESSSGEVGASALGAEVGGKRSSSESQLGHGGKITSCSTQEQIACRVPIRVELRPIKDGNAPAIAQSPTPNAPQNPNATADAMANVEKHKKIADLQVAASKVVNDKNDGAQCLELLGRALQLEPNLRQQSLFKSLRSRCLMRANQCDEGSRELRDQLAAEDEQRRSTDEKLDAEVRKTANRECSSTQAKNAADAVIRIERELKEAPPNGAAACLARFEAFEKHWPKIGKGDEENRAQTLARNASPALIRCVAKEKGCDAGKKLWVRFIKVRNPNIKDPERDAGREWPREAKRGDLECK
jgi:hypothetical protein